MVTDADKELFMKYLVANIRAARKVIRVTQQELADRSGLSQTFINYIETHRRLPSIFTLLEIAEALNCELILYFKPRADLQTLINEAIAEEHGTGIGSSIDGISDSEMDGK